MSALLKHHYTLEEYFDLELSTNERFEYFDGKIFTMSGASEKHDRIEWNLSGIFREKLRNKNCRFFTANMRIKVPSMPPYRYGDGSTLCGEAIFEKIGGVDALINPQLIVEILSPSTERYDRDQKFRHYKSIPDFGEYLLISQELAFIHHFTKNGHFWTQTEYNQLTDEIKLASLDCSMTLAEIYEGVELLDPEEVYGEAFNR